MLLLLSRTVGGMRTGDLHAITWEAFGPDFATLRVPRRKTRKRGKPWQELDVPEAVRPFVHAWWEASGSPVTGPVFPARQGKRAGQTKGKGSSYARQLREAMLDAGMRRHECTRPADAPPRKRGEPCCPAMASDPLYVETADTLPAGFHSTTRGGYCTALARANVNVQMANVLAGHSDPKVHQRYVASETIRALPEAALPPLPGILASSAQKRERRAREKPANHSVSLAPPGGVEPPTNGLGNRCSIL